MADIDLLVFIIDDSVEACLYPKQSSNQLQTAFNKTSIKACHHELMAMPLQSRCSRFKIVITVVCTLTHAYFHLPSEFAVLIHNKTQQAHKMRPAISSELKSGQDQSVRCNGRRNLDMLYLQE